MERTAWICKLKRLIEKSMQYCVDWSFRMPTNWKLFPSCCDGKKETRRQRVMCCIDDVFWWSVPCNTAFFLIFNKITFNETSCSSLRQFSELFFEWVQPRLDTFLWKEEFSQHRDVKMSNFNIFISKFKDYQLAKVKNNESEVTVFWNEETVTNHDQLWVYHIGVLYYWNIMIFWQYSELVIQFIKNPLTLLSE